MAKLIIKRKNEWINWIRTFVVRLNGTEIGTIENGQTKEFEIPAGTHKLKAKMNWYTSNEYSFSVAENDTHTVVLSAYKYANILVVIEALLIASHFILNYLYGINYIIWFAIPFVLITFYYATIGYNKYLLLKEDSLSLSF